MAQRLSSLRLDGVEGFDEDSIGGFAQRTMRRSITAYNESDRSWNGKTMSGPGMGTRPGRCTGSARSRNSPGMEATSSGRWTTSERHCAVTLASLAAVKKVVPNWSVTNATRRVVSQSSTNRPASIGGDRMHS
jgi:hypothetical protein